MNTSKANLLQAEAQFIEAENNYKRNEQLFKKGAISATEFDAFKRGYEVAKLGIEAARYQLKSAQATEKEAKDNLRRTTIYAPMDGTLSKLNVEVGERVVGTAQMAGTELLRIADLNNMEVLIEVNENDINKIKLNDSAYVEVEAVADKKFRGIVTRIANSSISKLNESATDQVSNFEVRIRIDKNSYEDLLQSNGLSPFRPGMSATVEIFTQLAKNAVAVPVQSVTLRPDTAEGKTSVTTRKLDEEEFECVFVNNNGKAKIRLVEIGIQDDKFFEIKKGLQEGDEIISGPYSIVSQKLKNNTSLKIKKK
jgi:HlyD family secretion protein